MARFYGTVIGGRGMATRLGHSATGLTVTAQSYSGDVQVEFWADGDTDGVSIRAKKHGDYGQALCIYHGPIAQLLDASARGTLMRALVEQELCA
jgi:hypothetical protein